MARPRTKAHGVYLRTFPSGRTAWYIRFRWQGRDVRRYGGPTRELARRQLRIMLADLERGRITLAPSQAETVAGAITRHQAMAQYQRNYRKTACFRAFWIAQLGTMPLAQITPAHLETAQGDLLAQQKAPATVNRYVDWLKHILHREVRLGHLATNPATRIRRLKEPDAPIHQYSIEQERALLAALGPDGPVVRLAILTGLRQAELFSIRKDWIHWPAGHIQIPTSKTGRPRVVLLTTEIAAIVRGLCERHPLSPHVFPSPKYPGRSLDPGAWYRSVFRPACLKAGLPPTLKFHSLRHTFGSRLAALGVSAHQIKALGGWSSDRASNRYVHFVQKDLLAVAEKLSGQENSDTMQGMEGTAS